MARPRQAQSTRRRPAAGKKKAAAASSVAPRAPSILAWEDDPGKPTAARRPISRPVPKLGSAPLPIRIVGTAPARRQFEVGSPEFRYWATAEALRRAADFWAAVLPKGTKWQPSNGARLPVRLDDGLDFNAFYDRDGLHFFHGRAKGITFYSGESPDVVCHELGHAILDALQPQLWDVLAGEAAAFHESFGDMSAILTALQLRSLREEVLTETGSRIDRSSRLSRLAEQLGWAIRQGHPDAVDADCLRNASNSWFYSDPNFLPPVAPATMLSSEPHSFSRIFTGAFLEILAGMFLAQPKHDQASLLATTRDAAAILIGGIKTSPIVPTYYSQVAAHMLDVDLTQHGGRYRDALKSAFVRHGVLSIQAATSPPPPKSPAAARRALATLAPGAQEAPLARIALSAAYLGLPQELLVSAASHPKRFAVAGAAPEGGATDSRSHDVDAASFLEDLVRRGRVDYGDHAVPGAAVLAPRARKTHAVVRDAGQLVLVRRYFDCGFDCGSGH
ncbi:MAG: hypothetical protein QOH95_1238 [Gaiellaceae bacterium]|nr:hypothetical protein [Gaiellaceae bacterium]